MKIDVHTHIIPQDMPKFRDMFGYGNFTHIEQCDNCRANLVNNEGVIFKNLSSNSWDARVRLKECDGTGVGIQVISTVPIMFNYWAKPKDCDYTSKFINDHISKVVSVDPKRFFGLGTLPMQDTELAIKELDRCVNELGLLGVEIGSNINGMDLNDEKVFPIFQAASDMSASIFIHPWDGMMEGSKMQSHWLPWLVGMPSEASRAICSMIFGGIFERLPKLRVLFAHGGGSFPATLGRIQHGSKVRPDLCNTSNTVSPVDSLGKFYVDSLVHSKDALSHLLSVFGVDKVCLGSDYPFPFGEATPGRLIEEDTGSFPQSLKDRIYYRNALRWVGKIKS